MLRAQQMTLTARIASTTVQTPPVDPARDVIRVQAGIHGASVAKVVKLHKWFLHLFYLPAKSPLKPAIPEPDADHRLRDSMYSLPCAPRVMVPRAFLRNPQESRTSAVMVTVIKSTEHVAPVPSSFVRIEAEALQALAVRLDGPMQAPFQKAVDLISQSVFAGQRITVTGIGKSGIIGRKVTAILRSTCSPAEFMHPAEALHGEAGIMAPSGVVLALSYSGTTKEIVRLSPIFQRLGMKLITFCGDAESPLARASDVFLDCGVSQEACMYNLSPTASTAVMLALGDALALSVSLACGRTAADFEDLHR